MNPINADAAELSHRMIERRAVEAVIWGMPIVNYDRMFEAALAAGAGPNQIVHWSRPFDWKNQTLTPNPNTLYLMPFTDTRSVGPMVLEIPPAEGGAIVGSLDDAWQMPIEDVGVAGVDKGKGGKYLYAGSAAQCRRHGGCLVRSQTARRDGVELDSDEGRRPVRSDLPLLRPRANAV